MVGGSGQAVVPTTLRQQSDESAILRIGDVLKESIYRRTSGGGPPVLLLAAGHRIDSELQLRQLRDEGHAVALPGEPSPSGVSISVAAPAGTNS